MQNAISSASKQIQLSPDARGFPYWNNLVLIEPFLQTFPLTVLVAELDAVDQHRLHNRVLHPVFRLLVKIRVEQFTTDGALLIGGFNITA